MTMSSSESNTLFVQGVPEGVTQAQFQTAVTGAAKDASKVNLNERKRFAHVVFESHEAAEKGLKALKKAHIGGQTLDFEWSVAKESNKVEFDEASNKTVYVRGLATTTEAEEIKSAFEDHGEIERCFLVNDKKTKASKGQAVVEFKTRSSAEKALELNETELGGQTITVEFAKAPRANNNNKGGKSQSNGGSAKKPAQKRKASDDDEEEKPAKKAKATETPKKEAAAAKKETPKKEAAKKETPKKEAAAASTKTTPKKETAAAAPSPKKETTPKKVATPSKAKGKK